ncbi:MAG: GGDEF domain-containing protein [Mariprofundus sp.]
MNYQDTLQQLLEDMDTIRPIILAAMPDDKSLRAMTRRMIADLESMKREPVVPANTYLWISQLTGKLLDAEHGALLRPDANGEVPPFARQAVENHTQQRTSLLMDALQNIPAAQRVLDHCCVLINQKPTRATGLLDKTRHLTGCLQTHLKQNTELRQELRHVIEALSPSLDAIAGVLQEAGEDSPELQLVKELLDQDLPDDNEQAKQLLQHARQGIMQAGAKLTTASRKLQNSIQSNLEQLNEMSGKLAQAESEARNDPLTGLANRRYLAEFLNTLNHDGFCFLICDIDFFKKINDNYGHPAGDEILRQLARILKESIRPTDMVARIGGEEFCIVFPATDLTNSGRLAETLRQAVAIHPFKTEQGNIDVNISIGVAAHEPNTSHAATFKKADAALYLSKENGRNQVTLADEKQA